MASSGDSFWDTATGNLSWPMSARIVFYPSLSRYFFFCCQGLLYFSLPLLPAQANVDRNTTAVEFPRNTTGDLDGKPIIEQNQQGKFA